VILHTFVLQATAGHGDPVGVDDDNDITLAGETASVCRLVLAPEVLGGPDNNFAIVHPLCVEDVVDNSLPDEAVVATSELALVVVDV
jgi:hypothetical protein